MKKTIVSILGIGAVAAAVVAVLNARRHAAVAGTALLLAAQTNANAALLINGAGSTFDNPAFTKWFSVYSSVDPGVNFNYQSIGSGAGKKQLQNKTVDFGASDAPMSDAELTASPGKVLHVPIVAGGVAIIYNLPGDPKLKLDGDTLAGIYLGNIKKWNDPKIAALNAGTELPDLPIVAVHRSDGSGTSFIFTDFLSAVNPAWADSVGKGSAVKWPLGIGSIGAKGSEGVAGQVKQLPG
ncbi:MAG TPA: phosphate ABC transporter substrate-binding protein PstS, partial [Desulfuromonadaceae bacterium]|nr:phosphate ABC transporter substrate-binding protein PstS [Desulfuromonadaceae bacterium]